MPIFLILFVLAGVFICTPYVALYWWIKPITTAGYFGVFAMGSVILITIVIVIGIIQNYRENRG